MAAYCSAEEVVDMIKGDLVNAILGDEYIEDETERLEKLSGLAENAVSDASAEIDGYLSKRYRLPFDKPPAVLNKFAKDIAAYNLVSRAGIDESDRDKTFLTRYNAAVKFLTMVAEGKIDIGTDRPQEAAASGFRMDSGRRQFSRNSLRGW